VAIKAMAPCLSTTASFAVPAPADDRDTFVYTFECSVVELLNRIHPHPHMKAVDHRFLVLAPKDRGASYVQCAFDGDDRDLMCEAASGFYDKRGRRAHFSQARRQALARLGFSTDGSHGNFQRLFNIRNTDMHREVADLLLGALFDGYGVRMNETIEVVAPFALKHGMLSRDRCVPVS
jgi:hypothetical protein